MACEKTVLDVTTEKRKLMFVSREESAGHNCTIKYRR
jgi:hypothetical protein